MRQFKNTGAVREPSTSEAPEVKLRTIDAVARELMIDDTRVVLVNVHYVMDMEKRLRQLETEVETLRTSKNSLIQMVNKISQKLGT